MDNVNWQALADETICLLQSLIRFETVSPPGNEIMAANWVANLLHENGIDPTVIELYPGRGNVVARLKGDGSEAPLMLYSHLDVVPVEREKWTMDPFGGEIKDGYVYGRGALDMKGIGAMQLAVFLALARAGRGQGQGQALPQREAPRRRDIILAMTADEETGDNQGIGPLSERHPDLIRAEYALSEFGGFSMYIGNKCFYPVQTAEKGTAWMRMVAKGRPGHASVPHDDNAVVHLARAVDKLGRAKLPMHLAATAQQFIYGIADGLGGATGAAMRALAASSRTEFALDAVVRDPGLAAELKAITHNTCSPTGLQAGMKTNVIPSDATAILDCRTVPGCSTQDLIAELTTVLGDDARFVEFVVDSESLPCEFDFNTPLFDLIKTKLKQHDPAGIPVPMMMTGATDAKHLVKLGTKCYGFSPMRFMPGEKAIEMVHGHDERVGIDSLAWGSRVLYETVAEFCGGVGG